MQLHLVHPSRELIVHIFKKVSSKLRVYYSSRNLLGLCGYIEKAEQPFNRSKLLIVTYLDD